MARKILIAIALIIAVFPYLGFSETADVSVTTTLGFLMAAVLLLSRKPKTRNLDDNENNDKKYPSSYEAAAQELAIAHEQETSLEHYAVITKEAQEEQRIATPIHSEEKISSVDIKNPSTQRESEQSFIRRPKISRRTSEERVPEIAEGVVIPTRKIKKHTPKVVLAYEEQVHPADIPVPADVQAAMHLDERSQ